MKKRLLPLLGAAALLSLGTSASATVYNFETSLAGANEDPAVPSTGTGSAHVVYDDAAHTLSIHLEFADLVGTTTVAHIHAPTAVPFSGNVGVATFPGTFPGFPSGVTSGVYDGSWDLTDPASYTGGFLNNFGGGTAAGAEARLFNAMATGQAYVNIHSSFAGGGEIRGFLRPVPDTGSMAILLGSAMVALFAFSRFYRK
jgi:hypothetical protein